jgi:hypothetical protein
MFFAKTKDAAGDAKEGEILAIFGSRRGRRGAELKAGLYKELKGLSYQPMASLFRHSYLNSVGL